MLLSARDAMMHERDLAERLVGVRQRDDHLVGGRRGAERRRPAATGRSRRNTLTPHACMRDELAVGRQPAEADQDAEQQRHRDREAERLREQRQQDAQR